MRFVMLPQCVEIVYYMENTISKSSTGLKDYIEGLFEKERNLHLLFWVLLSIFLILIDRSESEFYIKFLKSFISVGFFAIIVYINWHVLIPKFLKQRSWILYLISLMILTLVMTPPKTLAFFLLYDDYPAFQQYFLQNQNFLLFESIFVGAASAAFKITQDWLSHERDRKELQSQQLQSELNFLKAQINPHFLFNTLNNLYALSLKKSEDAPKTVLMLSEMMRYMLYECNAAHVPLQKEINYLKNYLELEKIRLGKNFQVNFDVVGDSQTLEIAPLVFIPFVENSFKHGMNTQINDGFINISFQIEDGLIDFEISNSRNKQPIRSLTGKKSGGIGLINIKRRLKLIYPEKHTLEVIEHPETYTTKLQIDLNKNTE